jgi:hypothetical protein
MAHVAQTPEDAFDDLEYIATIAGAQDLDEGELCRAFQRNRYYKVALVTWLKSGPNPELHQPSMEYIQSHVRSCFSCQRQHEEYAQGMKELEVTLNLYFQDQAAYQPTSAASVPRAQRSASQEDFLEMLRNYVQSRGDHRVT